MTGNRGGPIPLAKPAATWSHAAGKRQVLRRERNWTRPGRLSKTLAYDPMVGGRHSSLSGGPTAQRRVIMKTPVLPALPRWASPWRIVGGYGRSAH